MCKFKDLGISWPPKGWKQFKDIDQSFGQAIVKNPASAVVTGISYIVEPVPIRECDGDRRYYYTVQINGWDYNIYNESCEYSILSFIVHDKLNSKAPKHDYMSDVKTQAQTLKVTERSAHRSFMAALFIMKQISLGRVPDIDRILKLYKIHPTQRDLYSIDVERSYSSFCGLPDTKDAYTKKETAL